MYDAALKAIEALRAYVVSEEVGADLADEMCGALEGLLRAISMRDVAIAEEYDRYWQWLGED